MSIHRLLTVYETQKLAKISKIRKFNLENDLLTLRMTSGDVENDTIELAILKNSSMDPAIF